MALQILEHSGFPALSASALCDQMAVTRGSFYHHFANFDDFVDGLLEHWEERCSRELIHESADVEDLVEMLRWQAQLAASLPQGAEVSLRAWATVNPRVGAALRRVDQLRHDGLTQSFIDHAVPAATAEIYADISLNALTGAQMSRATPGKMLEMYDELGALLIAKATATSPLAVGGIRTGARASAE
jgi:AcrR family transcriptional regulator